MRLQEIQGRTPDQVQAAVEVALTKYRRGRAAIYKGSLRYGHRGIFFRDPRAHPEPRISANTENYATLWVDNDPRWAEFPRRSRSLICSISPSTAGGYGDVAVVVPLQDTAIGICPANDFWGSFRETSPSDWLFINDLNRAINSAIVQMTGKTPDQRTLTYPQMMDLLGQLPQPDTQEAHASLHGFQLMAARLGWVGMMEQLMDPMANRFRVTTWQQFSLTGDREVWLSTACAMVPLEIFQALASGERSFSDVPLIGD